MADSLLDFLQQPDAQLGLALLAAGGSTSRPMGVGERIFGALQSVQGQQDAALRRRYVESQLADNQSQAAYRMAQMGQLQQDQALTSVIMDRFKNRMGLTGGAGVPGLAPSGVPIGAAGSAGAPAAIGGGVASPSGAAPAGVGGYPFSLDEIAMLTAAGRKGADGMFNQYKYATDGVKREAGATYLNPITGEERYFPKLGEGQMIGRDGVVRNADGYALANAQTKGLETLATERARYPFTVGADRARQTTQAALDPMKVVGDDGNEYYLPRLQVAGAVGGGGGGPGGGGAPGAGGFMAGRNPITQQSQTALNDNWIKSTYQPTLDAGKAASDSTASLTALRGIDLSTGWGTEAKATAANALVGLGIAPKNAEIFAGNAQKFQAVAMKQLLQTFEGQKGQQTEGDARRVSQTFAALSNTPEANAFMIDFAQAKANMDARKAAYYEQALPIAQKRGDLTEVDRQWRKVAGSVWADPVMQRWAK